MSDGTRLAARLWRPRTDSQVPAILEYIPYRKTDMVRARDERNHPFFASHGYASIRVDMRGSGDSEGDMPDMYAPAELSDAREVISWVSAQPWCNGRVGMFGTSWGGTAALQASLTAPDALKTIIAVCATHDRFEDDIHYMGGCVLSDTFEWGATLPAILASPPTPSIGKDWKEQWRARIDALSNPLENWLREKARGAYWRHGSVIHSPERLSVPILAIGGWSDRYSNSVMSLVDARPDLVRGVVGPWGHQYPDQGSPGPAMGFQQLALQWWDQHLKGDNARPNTWPQLQTWLREFDTPGDSLDQRAGRWLQSEAPSQVTEAVHFDLDALAPAAASAPWSVPQDPTIGQTSGDTGYFGRFGGLPLDQSRDDERSLVFETAPLPHDLMIYGAAVLTVQVQTLGRPSKLVIRLSDVRPDGVMCRICYGVRNLALNETLDTPKTPIPDAEARVSVPMHTTAYRIRQGHRLRIALSSSLWPLIWSGNPKGRLAIYEGRLTLPVLSKEPPMPGQTVPEPHDLPAKKSHSVISAPALERWAKYTENRSEIGWRQPMTKVTYHETQTTFGYQTRMQHTQDVSDQVRERVEVDHRMEFERPDGTATVASTLKAGSQEDKIVVKQSLSVTWNGTEIARRTWAFTS